MFEQMVKNTADLNTVAEHLRNIKSLDELRRLAAEWLVPCQDLNDFIAGKRFQLVDIEMQEKDYASAEEKLREEMWILKDREFADILAQYLIKKCEDESFSAQVIQKHKTLQKCLNYVIGKVYEVAEEKYKGLGDEDRSPEKNSVGLAMSEVQVYKWADEYYALDDAEEEAKKAEETKKELKKKYEQEEKLKASSVKAKTSVGKKNKTSGSSVPKKKEEKSQEAQISLFDLMNGGNPDGQEDKDEGI